MSPDGQATLYDAVGTPMDVRDECVELDGFVADSVLTTDRCVRLFVATSCDEDAEPFCWIVEPGEDLTYLGAYGPHVRAAMLL